MPSHIRPSIETKPAITLEKQLYSPGRCRVRLSLGSRCHFHLGVEIGDDVLERGNRLLNSGDLHQFPSVDRAIAVLQSDHQIASLLFELDERQAVVRQMFQHDASPVNLSDGQAIT